MMVVETLDTRQTNDGNQTPILSVWSNIGTSLEKRVNFINLIAKFEDHQSTVKIGNPWFINMFFVHKLPKRLTHGLVYLGGD